jgi:hypothetical protein
VDILPVKGLSRSERKIINILLRSELVREGNSFTSAQAWDIIKDIPTKEKTDRKIISIPNKYKLTHLLKKCEDFTRYKDGNGTSIWEYIGDYHAS